MAVTGITKRMFSTSLGELTSPDITVMRISTKVLSTTQRLIREIRRVCDGAQCDYWYSNFMSVYTNESLEHHLYVAVRSDTVATYLMISGHDIKVLSVFPTNIPLTGVSYG